MGLRTKQTSNASYVTIGLTPIHWRRWFNFDVDAHVERHMDHGPTEEI
jgi:hypothetical protein